MFVKNWRATNDDVIKSATLRSDKSQEIANGFAYFGFYSSTHPHKQSSTNLSHWHRTTEQTTNNLNKSQWTRWTINGIQSLPNYSP